MKETLFLRKVSYEVGDGIERSEYEIQGCVIENMDESLCGIVRPTNSEGNGVLLLAYNLGGQHHAACSAQSFTAGLRDSVCDHDPMELRRLRVGHRDWKGL